MQGVSRWGGRLGPDDCFAQWGLRPYRGGPFLFAVLRMQSLELFRKKTGIVPGKDPLAFRAFFLRKEGTS